MSCPIRVFLANFSSKWMGFVSPVMWANSCRSFIETTRRTSASSPTLNNAKELLEKCRAVERKLVRCETKILPKHAAIIKQNVGDKSLGVIYIIALELALARQMSHNRTEVTQKLSHTDTAFTRISAAALIFKIFRASRAGFIRGRSLFETALI